MVLNFLPVTFAGKATDRKEEQNDPPPLMVSVMNHNVEITFENIFIHREVWFFL